MDKENGNGSLSLCLDELKDFQQINTPDRIMSVTKTTKNVSNKFSEMCENSIYFYVQNYHLHRQIIDTFV